MSPEVIAAVVTPIPPSVGGLALALSKLGFSPLAKIPPRVVEEIRGVRFGGAGEGAADDGAGAADACADAASDGAGAWRAAGEAGGVAAPAKFAEVMFSLSGTLNLQDVESAALVLPQGVVAAGTLNPQYVESAELALPQEVVPMRREVEAQSISQSERTEERASEGCRGNWPEQRPRISWR